MAPSRKRKRGIRRAASRPSPIPPGYPTVIPYLAVTAGAAALDFYPKAFGAKVLARQLTPDGKLVHGRLRIGNSLFMVSDVFPGGDVAAPSTVGTTTVTLHLYSKNVDALWDRAVAAGAKVTMPLENQYLGGAVRPPSRSVRPPLVALDAGQDEPGGKGGEAEGSDGLVRARGTSGARTSRQRRLSGLPSGPQEVELSEPDPCDLHEAAIRVGSDEAETLHRLARSPIADECRSCAVCRLAREYVQRRLAEQAGRVFPPEESGEATWRKLQAAVNGVKVTVHRPA